MKNILENIVKYWLVLFYMATRKAIPEKMKKLIYQQFKSACGFCRDDNINVLEIHHIQPYSEVKKHEEDNLVIVCRNCHAKIDNKEISESDVLRKKISAIRGKLIATAVAHSNSNILHFQPNSVNDSTFITGQNITVKTQSKKAPKKLSPQGAIASDTQKKNYIKYLIDRYHEFKETDKNINTMNRAIIYSTIKRQFKAKWDMIEINKFNALSGYLHNRIDKTILGKNRKAKGNKNYSSFQEYIKETNK